MGTRWKQIFMAPGENDSEPLPLPASPWHAGRSVSLPREHWELLIRFARTVDAELAELMDGYSNAHVEQRRANRVRATAEELARMVRFLSELIPRLRGTPALSTGASVEEDFLNEEYIRMLEAVIAVMREALQRGERFRAWIE
jgi:hypothetical protein